MTPSPLPGWADEGAASLVPWVEPPPDLCTWLGAVDAVVWGKLVSVELPLVPATRPRLEDDGWDWLPDGCPESPLWKPGLRLTLDVEVVVKGDLEPGLLEVVAGAIRLDTFAPAPLLNDAGEVEWGATTSQEGAPLQVGQMLGLPVHWLADFDVYSLLGESLMGQDEAGHVVFQPESERMKHSVLRAPVDDVAGLGILELVDAANACPPSTTASDSRRTDMYASWGPFHGFNTPAVYMSAYCPPVWDTPDPPPAPGTCNVADDCPEGQFCICPDDDGACTCQCVGGPCE